jgi:hypothetical protein
MAPGNNFFSKGKSPLSIHKKLDFAAVGLNIYCFTWTVYAPDKLMFKLDSSNSSDFLRVIFFSVCGFGVLAGLGLFFGL